MLWLLLGLGGGLAYLASRPSSEGSTAGPRLSADATGTLLGQSGVEWIYNRGDAAADGRRVLGVNDPDSGQLLLSFIESPDGSLAFFGTAPNPHSEPQARAAFEARQRQARADFQHLER